MALAERLHHTSRSQRFARAAEEHDSLRRQRPPPPQPELFQLFEEEEPGGSRPPCLGEPRGPQEKVQQCTVEQLADVVPMVQILDTPGLLGGGSGGGGAADARHADYRAGRRSAQVLFGPGPPAFCPSSSAEGRRVGGSADGARIFTGGHCRACPGAEGCNGIGRADREQSSSSGSAGGVAEVCKQGLRAGLDSTAADVEQIFDIPVRPQGDGVQQRMWSRSLLFQLMEVSKLFFQAKIPHRADFFKMRMRDFKGGFSHFSPAPKEWEGYPPVESENARQCQLIRAERSSMAPAGESGELADEPGGALDGALADLQRWRRGLRRRDGGGEGGGRRGG